MTNTHRQRLIAAILPGLALAVIGALPAHAERLVVALASERIGITSSFSGTQVIAISVVERDGQSVSRSGDYDAVVLVRGPLRTQVTRRKVRWLGLWVNGPSRTYVGTPTYFAALANRPFSDIANDRLRAEHSLGLDALKLSTRGRLPGGDEDRVFRDAFVAAKKADALYFEGETNISFITDNVFRSHIPLPANTPVGAYSVEVLLFSGGALIARSEGAFETVKEGLEATIFRASREQPLAYGLFSVALALAMGWIAGIVFRRN